MKDIYIIGGSRTPQGSFMGALSQIPAPKLASFAIKDVINKTGIDKNLIQEVYMGEVIQAGVGQAPARQAALFAELPESVTCTTVNKVCGSGMEAVILAALSINAGESDLAIAGGMENMSLAPHLMPNSRSGYRFGNTEIKDAMLMDGLWDVYSNRAMGNCAEECVKKYTLSRESQDEFAIESFKRAQKAISEGIFKSEIAPVIIAGKKGDTIIDTDEGPAKAQFDKMAGLKPAFEKDGTITAANASTINDGASALILASEKYKSKAKFKILSFARHAQSPTWFTTAPVEAIKKNLKKQNMKVEDIDLFEINEAFALVTMVTMKELNIPHSKVNIYGGGVSLGHPIGNSGSRVIVTLMNALERNNKKFGLASLCIGGGEALSLIIERM